MNEELNRNLRQVQSNIPTKSLASNDDAIVCQFYIVLGEHDRVFKSDIKNRYFYVAKSTLDPSLILRGLSSAYDKIKMSPQRIVVAKNLICLIPNRDYLLEAGELMKKLDPHGKIQIVPSIKKEVVVPKTVAPAENTNLSDNVAMAVPEIKETKEINTNESDSIKEKPKYSYQPGNNVYHGDFDTSGSGSSRSNGDGDNSLDAATYMWGKTDNKKFVKVKKPNKSSAFINFPVIVFIISFILLVASVILLFVLK